MDWQEIRFREPMLTFLVAAVLMGAAALVTGPNLGAFFAAIAICSLIVPAALPEKPGNAQDLLGIASVTDAAALVLLVLALGDESVSLWAWLKAYLLLLALAMFQAGLMRSLRAARLSRMTAAGGSILLMMLWLAAPVWLLHHLQSPRLLAWMQRVIDVHPLFAMNAATQLGIWTESPLAYRVLNLNQDVYYTMPEGPWLSILFHAFLGAGMIWINHATASRLYK